MSNPEMKARLISELSIKLGEAPQDWDPHLRLEYTKMCIRSIAELLQSEMKLRMKTEEELELTMRALESDSTAETDKDALIEHVELLRGKKEVLNEEKGKALAARLGTKWYNKAALLDS